MPHLLRESGGKCDSGDRGYGEPSPHKPNKKGFTLIEILIVVMIFAVIATLALSTYVKSTGTFDFLSNYKNVLSALRTARVYALTNRYEDGVLPERYGVRIDLNKVTVFADTGPTAFEYDPVEAACADFLCPEESAAGDYDPIIKNFDLAATNYLIEAFDSNFNAPGSNLTLPLLIFYGIGSGELTVYENAVEVPKNEHKFIIIRVYDGSLDLERHIMLFLVSGLPEEYDNLE